MRPTPLNDGFDAAVRVLIRTMKKITQIAGAVGPSCVTAAAAA